MTSISESHNVLKTDAKGRVRVPAERREALLDEFERSGLSGAKFAKLAGIKYPTFALWVQKRREARAAAGEASQQVERLVVEGPGPIRLVEAVAEWSGKASAESVLRVELPGGAQMHLESAAQLRLGADLLHLLAARGERVC